MSPAPDLSLERIERLEDVRDDWTRLAEATGHPFASYEWNEPWWRHFAAGRELYTFACRDTDGRVRAILPLYVATARPVRVARFLGYGDLMSPLCEPEDRPLAAAALSKATRRPHDCRILLAERLPGDKGWGELLGGKLLGIGHDPVLPFDGMSWDEFLASRSKNFRDQVRRRERKIVRETGLEFRRGDDPARLREDMETLFRLHQARWGEETTGVFEESAREFHQEVAAAALDRGWLRLWIAEVDGEPVAAWYGWRFAGCEWYYQAGRDQRFEKLSLGFVLLAHTVREACRDGAHSYHFLAGAEDYKWRFAKEDPGAESRLLGSGFAARLGRLGITLGGALPAPARRRVMRIAR